MTNQKTKKRQKQRQRQRQKQRQRQRQRRFEFPAGDDKPDRPSLMLQGSFKVMTN